MLPVMAGAGGSARKEYERRRAKDRASRKRSFKRSLVIVLATPFVVYGFVRLAADVANRWLLSWMFRQFGATGPSEVMDGKTANFLGLALAAVATLRMATDLWGARRTTESWRKGYEGEVMTAGALERLPPGYSTLHDLRIPGSKANIDHLVIGPTGVFTVETKHYSSDVVIRRGVAKHAGRSMDTVVEQANRQADTVRAVLGCGVRAVVCVQGAGVTVEGWFSKSLVDGVRFCSGNRIVETITRLDREHADEEVRRLADLAEQRLGRDPAGSPVPGAQVCDCGSSMVLRKRKADRSSFWGCTRYPNCRVTRSASTP